MHSEDKKEAFPIKQQKDSENPLQEIKQTIYSMKMVQS